MKKCGIVLFLISLIFLTSFELAGPDRKQCNQFLERTNKALIAAHSALKKSKVFKGNYALAVRHQQYAKKLYIQRRYRNAVFHSRRARILALEAIRDNSGKSVPETSFTKNENEMMGSSFPKNSDLDRAIAMDGRSKIEEKDLLDEDLDLKLPD